MRRLAGYFERLNFDFTCSYPSASCFGGRKAHLADFGADPQPAEDPCAPLALPEDFLLREWAVVVAALEPPASELQLEVTVTTGRPERVRVTCNTLLIRVIRCNEAFSWVALTTAKDFGGMYHSSIAGFFHFILFCNWIFRILEFRGKILEFRVKIMSFGRKKMIN